jgi:hypothetical protein
MSTVVAPVADIKEEDSKRIEGSNGATTASASDDKQREKRREKNKQKKKNRQSRRRSERQDVESQDEQQAQSDTNETGDEQQVTVEYVTEDLSDAVDPTLMSEFSSVFNKFKASEESEAEAEEVRQREKQMTRTMKCTVPFLLT